YLGSSLDFDSTTSHNSCIYSCIWKNCEYFDRWSSRFLILYGRKYSMVVLFRMFTDNSQCIFRKCKIIWKGLFSKSRYANFRVVVETNYVWSAIFTIVVICSMVSVSWWCTDYLVLPC